MQRENSILSVQKGGLQPIGVSFPKYNALTNTLGDKIRLFAENIVMLEQFNANILFENSVIMFMSQIFETYQKT